MISSGALRLAEPDPRQRLGLAGEAAAERALRAAGLTIVERRFRCRRGEIDLIAADGALVVFVEVKTRRVGRTSVAPAEAVTALKRRRLARVAREYLCRRGLSERPCRFDVVEVRVDPSGRFIARHISDAFRLWPTG